MVAEKTAGELIGKSCLFFRGETAEADMFVFKGDGTAEIFGSVFFRGAVYSRKHESDSPFGEAYVVLLHIVPQGRI